LIQIKVELFSSNFGPILLKNCPIYLATRPIVCLPTSPSSSSFGTNVAILSNTIKSQPASINLSITTKHSCKWLG
jgi:hypothetical protein